MDVPYFVMLVYLVWGIGFSYKFSLLIGILSAVVLIGSLLYLSYRARRFLIDFYRPSDSKKLGRRIQNRLWGWHQFFFRKTILITSTTMDPVDHWSRWLGGPADLVIYDGFAAYLELGNQFHRVVGAGIPLPYLDTRETIKTIVDLRPQFREFDANAWTKDGIKVLLEARIEARIGRNYSPEVADPKRLYPFDAESVRHAVEYTSVRLQPDGKLVEADWCDGAIGKLKGLLAHHIASRRLDELYLTDRGEGQILSAEIMQNLLDEANAGLRRNGIHISNVQIIKTQIPEDVYGQRLDVWKAGKESIVTRIQGQARASEIRIIEESRARAQRELIVSITRSLERINPDQFPQATLLSLAKILDRGLKDPLVRALMSRETLLLLENLNLLN